MLYWLCFGTNTTGSVTQEASDTYPVHIAKNGENNKVVVPLVSGGRRHRRTQGLILPLTEVYIRHFSAVPALHPELTNRVHGFSRNDNLCEKVSWVDGGPGRSGGGHD